RGAFEDRYAALFRRIIPRAPVEVVSWQARLAYESWRPSPVLPVAPAETPEARGRRGVFDASFGSFVDYTIYERADFRPGACVSAPVLVVEDETTTVVPAAFSVSVDARAHLILQRNASEGLPV